RFEVPYELIYKERIKAGGLRSAYDVILIPSQSSSAKQLVHDVDSRGKVLAYQKSDKFQFLGRYGESADISGGMGLGGVVELEKFVQAGGTLITLGGASYFAPDFGLALRVQASRPSPAFYAPGPIVETQILRADHPLFYGYGDAKTLPVRYANGPILNLPDLDKGQVLLRYTGTDRALLSGHIRGMAELKDKAAIVDVPAGSGRILIFATNPCYRWQNHGEFPMLFNALMHYNDRPGAAPATPASATGGQ
ncbi:MAG: hypothetical protein JNK87_29745, partial [Bryobacterales bacterium]|nr:hypothetical protein [Bryobacterales bacterium]